MNQNALSVAFTAALTLTSASRISAPAPAAVYSVQDGRTLTREEFSQRLAAARVVYVGEQHTQASHHAVELEVLRLVLAREPSTAVGVEMLDQSRQEELDAFLAGRLDDAGFRALWEKQWGFSYDLYRPLLEFCRARGVPVKALNAPRAVIGKIARSGLASLSPEERHWLPSRVEPTKNPAYLAYVKDSLSGHGPLSPEREARMLEAMTAWNETMGQAAADAVASGGSMVVLAGYGHVVLNAGILESVRRRSNASQLVVLPYPLDGAARPTNELIKELRDPDTAALAGYFWLLPAQ